MKLIYPKTVLDTLAKSFENIFRKLRKVAINDQGVIYCIFEPIENGWSRDSGGASIHVTVYKMKSDLLIRSIDAVLGPSSSEEESDREKCQCDRRADIIKGNRSTIMEETASTAKSTNRGIPSDSSGRRNREASKDSRDTQRICSRVSTE